MIEKGVKFGVVDYQQRYLKWKYGIKAVPTVKCFGRDKKADPLTYEGPRDSEKLSEFILN